MSNNLCFLHGHVGKDPELKTTPGGQNFARFPFATSETWTDPQGNKQKKDEWHSIIAWGPLAERCGKYIHKGMELNLEGKIEYQPRYEDNDKTKARVYPDFCNIKLRDFTFCGKKDSNGGSNRPDPEPSGREAVDGQNGESRNETNSSNGGTNTSSYDDEIPF